MNMRNRLQKELFERRNGLLRSFSKIKRKIREKSQSPEKHLEKLRQN